MGRPSLAKRAAWIGKVDPLAGSTPASVHETCMVAGVSGGHRRRGEVPEE